MCRRRPAARGSRSASRCTPRSTGTCATPACACTPRCICSRRCCPIRSPAARSATTESRLDFDIPEAGLDKDDDHREARRDDRGRRRGDRALDHRRRARSQPRPGQDHVGEAADGHRPRAADRDRGLRPAALRRHPRAHDRRDRRRAGHADREEGQAEPPRAHRVREPASERERSHDRPPARQPHGSSAPTGSPRASACPTSSSSTARSTCRR